MIFIPAIFFGTLFFYSFSRKGFDLGVCMIFLYLVTSLGAVWLYFADPNQVYLDWSSFRLEAIPTFLYCILIFLGLKPFMSVNTNKALPFRRIVNLKYFNKIGIAYFVVFVLLLMLFYQDIFNGILTMELDEMRKEASSQELENALSRQTSFIGKLLGYGLAYGSGGSIYMILFFFYSICFTNNSKLKTTLFLVGSLSTILMGILNVDRSCVIHWGLSFITAFFIFRPYMNTTAKNFVRAILIMFGSLLFVYFVAVTISRFSILDGGVTGGLMSYIGQSYLNFCNIWENVDVDDVYIGRIIPAINYFFVHQEYSAHQLITHGNAVVNGFQTYIGIYYLDFGHIGAIILALLVAFVMHVYCRKFRLHTFVTLNDFIRLFMVAIVMQFGCIAYQYSNMGVTMNLAFMLFLISKFKFEKKPCNIIE